VTIAVSRAERHKEWWQANRTAWKDRRQGNCFGGGGDDDAGASLVVVVVVVAAAAAAAVVVVLDASADAFAEALTVSHNTVKLSSSDCLQMTEEQ
jgi:hypothetical protein